MHFVDDFAGSGIEHVDEIGRTAFPGRNVEQPAVRIDRQSVDARIDNSVPNNRIVVEIQAKYHADFQLASVRDVESAGSGARGNSSYVAAARNGANGLDRTMPLVDVVDRNRAPVDGRLIDRIEVAMDHRRYLRGACCSFARCTGSGPQGDVADDRGERSERARCYQHEIEHLDSLICISAIPLSGTLVGTRDQSVFS